MSTQQEALTALTAPNNSYTATHLIQHRQKSRDRGSRGLSVWIHDKWLPLTSPAHFKAETNTALCGIHFTIQLSKWHLKVFALYGENSASVQYWQNVENWITSKANDGDRIILMGDLNIAPDPQLDRFPPHDKPDPAHLAFHHLLSKKNLTDIWRDLHEAASCATLDKATFTWSRNGSRSRIDMPLISTSLREQVEHCEILHGIGASDHFPIELLLQLPETIVNMASEISEPPEIATPVIDISNLSIPANCSKFQELFTEEALSIIQDTADPLAAYSQLQALIYNSAVQSLGYRTKVLNRRRRQIKPSPFDLSRGHCEAVIAGEPLLMREVKNGNYLRSTEAMQKLCRNLPSSLQLPPIPHTNDPLTASTWFQSVRTLSFQLTEKITSSHNSKRVQRIIEAIETRNRNERNIFRAARHLKSAAKCPKTQRTVINEVDPTQNAAPEFEDASPEGVKTAIKKYYEHAARDRVPTTPSPKEWVTEAFKAHRAATKGKYNGELMAPISPSEILATITAQSKGKAAGPDDIPIELLKALPQKAITLLALLMSKFLNSGETPHEWRTCRIFTIHKGGDVSRCSNYRPISLQSTIYKTFMTILTKRLTELVEENQLLSNAQGGFRKDRSCLEKIELLNRIRKATKAAQSPLHIMFADIKKAYDCIRFDDLVQALHHHQLDPKFVSLIGNIYTGNTADVITVFGITDKFKIGRGVKQGCPMSPILFNLFLEPMLDWIQLNFPSSFTMAYADDLSVSCKDKDSLQTITTEFQHFLYHHGMELGIAKDKTKTAYMTTDKNPNTQINIQTTTTSQVNEKLTLILQDTTTPLPKLTGKESYKYLGVWWNIEGDSEPHLAHAQAKLFFMCRNLKRAAFTTQQTVTIFNRVVLPAAAYGFEVAMPTKERLLTWEGHVRSLLNKKVGIHWNSTMHLHLLSTERLGLGARSFLEELDQAKLRKVTLRGLNSVDTQLAELSRTAFKVKEVLIENPTTEETELLQSCPNLVSSTPITIKVSANIAHTADSDSFRHIFPKRDPAWQILKQLNIRKTHQLIDEEGNIHQHLRGTPSLANIIARICITGTHRVVPLILYRLHHSALLRPAHNSALPPGETLRIFTDASKSESDGNARLGYGIHHPDASAKDNSTPVNGNLNISTVENLAIAAALAGAGNSPVVIYTDSLNASQTIQHMLKHGKLPKKTPLLAREPAHMTYEILCARRQYNIRSDIQHVMAHSTDGTLSATETERRKLINTQHHGQDAAAVALGNMKADALAKQANTPIPNLTPLSRHLPNFLLVDSEDNVIANPPKLVHDSWQSEYKMRALKETRAHLPGCTDTRKMYDWLNDDSIDWKRSTYLLKNRDPKLNRLQNFSIRVRRGLIADKQTRLARQQNAFWAKRYDVKVANDKCDQCAQTETRFHFCECPAAADLRAEAKTDILEVINANLKSAISNAQLPCFWAIELRTQNPQADIWKRIESFKTERAAMGMIPNAFVQYLKGLPWKANTDFEGIIADIQIIVVRCHHLAWVERCAAFNRIHTNPERARRRVSDVDRREQLRRDRAGRRRQLRRTKRKPGDKRHAKDANNNASNANDTDRNKRHQPDHHRPPPQAVLPP